MDAFSTLAGLVIVALIVWLLRPFVESYSKKKGENLATKEDVEEITQKVEAIKGEISKELEFVKWELGNKATVHRLAAEKEFQAYAEIGKTLVEFEAATVSLRPLVDFQQSAGSPEENFNQRYKRWWQAGYEFHRSVERFRLFLPDDIYRQLNEILDACKKEGISFEVSYKFGSEPGKLTREDYQMARQNIKEINTVIESTLRSIRERLQMNLRRP
jgi:hypothetical protein